MVLLLFLIRYVVSAAKRRWTAEVALSALAAVLVLSMGLLIIKVTGDAPPRDETQLALLR
jgi:hypothetical protein